MQPPPPPPAFDAWLQALEARHFERLRFAEIVRALRALSAVYVARRSRLATRGTLDSDGKRAAFALYYGPLHFLLVHAIVHQMDDAVRADGRLLDLGCGTGAAGAAWASTAPALTSAAGIDVHPWAVSETAATWRQFHLDADVRRGHLARNRWPRADAIVAAFTVNELAPDEREVVLQRLLAARQAGARVLVVEPLSRAVSPWWTEWSERIEDLGGRADEWRFPTTIPPLVGRLADAAGLRPEGVAGRSLWM
jgi:ribosomal protein RSM22 (predicted rRNA methylase)